MLKNRFIVRKICIGFLLLVTAFSVNATADDERLAKLEKEIKEIKIRLSNLEKLVVGNNHFTPPVSAGDGWKYLKSWRTLKSGMSYEDVRSILGEPSKIDGGSVAYWYYANGGKVIFVRDKIQSWEEPSERIQ